MASTSEIIAGATLPNFRVVQITGVAGSQRSTSGGAACQEKEVEGVGRGPSLGGQKSSTNAVAVAVAAPDHVGTHMMAKV